MKSKGPPPTGHLVEAKFVLQPRARFGSMRTASQELAAVPLQHFRDLKSGHFALPYGELTSEQPKRTGGHCALHGEGLYAFTRLQGDNHLFSNYGSGPTGSTSEFST